MSKEPVTPVPTGSIPTEIASTDVAPGTVVPETTVPETSQVAPPRISRRRAAMTVVAAMAGAGVPIGGLWLWIAPPVHGVIALTRSGERAQIYLGNESDNFFVSAFMMLGLLWVLSVVAPVLVWQWRAHRGPVMVAALSVGAAVSAAVATTIGAQLARVRYPVVDIDSAPVTPDDRVYYFTQAPSVFFGHTPLQMAATLLVPAAIVALVYALFTVSTLRDDLGAYPPADSRQHPVPVPDPPIAAPDQSEQADQADPSMEIWSDPQRSNRDSGNRST